jgi:hypothetical protein
LLLAMVKTLCWTARSFRFLLSNDNNPVGQSSRHFALHFLYTSDNLVVVLERSVAERLRDEEAFLLLE